MKRVIDILKNKPKGTLLYSPALGNVRLEEIVSENDFERPIRVKESKGNLTFLFPDGYLTSSIYAEQQLFPSKNMRDWSKFGWNYGDTLYGNGHTVRFIEYLLPDDDSRYCLADNYVKFRGQIITPVEKQGEYDNFTTESFELVNDKQNNELQPFDKVLYVDSSWIYKIGFYGYYKDGKYRLMYCEGQQDVVEVYPYKDDFKYLLGNTVNEDNEKFIKSILDNENN